MSVSLLVGPPVGLQTTITSTMVSALNSAISTMNSAVGNGSLDDLSIMQLQPIIAAFQNAYDVFASGITIPLNLDLDAVGSIGTSDGASAYVPNSASIVDGWNLFVNQVNAVASDSDINVALGYIARIIQNLTRAPG